MGERSGVVYDTNVLVSALGWSGKPEECLELVFNDQITGYTSPSILDEVWSTMEYPRFGFTEEEMRSFLGILTAAFQIVKPEVSVSQSRDPDDDKFLEAAVAAGADYIVSGDDDLLDLEAFQGIEIVPPARFLELCQE